MTIRPLLHTPDSIQAASARWRNEGLTIVFTNGCFDLIHPGHVRYLRDARQLGDLLVVGINTDGSVARIKGPGRPILDLGERSEVLLALRWVDAVVPFDDPTPLDLIERIRPHVLVKGGDWPVDKIVGREVVEAAGGKVLSLPFHEGASTSGIIDRIRSAE
ncbi:MAG: D-glycero-beta-D-manno-heptose 1-phosphate adenylyltransferase [bacterium]|nr:D-glycero-beta-D-manno-heptose 1-phosphate adenylyltransferase [bacterium]MDT8395652.1 D-glycero-beta-D-manno-heptose 1-phosphate adenylyltransferase [bacterium]